MPVLAVTAVGADRPGIIARVTGVLLQHGGNLEDSAMTILGGQFAIVLLVSAEGGASALEASLAAATADLGLVVTVREVGAGAEHAPPTHVLSVYGGDRPGIVHAVATALASASVNVTDLRTHAVDGTYVVLLEVSAPPEAAPHLLERLRADPALDDVEISVNLLDPVVL